MKKGNIVLTFILLIALSAFVTVFLFMISGNLRQVGSQGNSEKALYIADAGLEKAIWYLKTPISQGGMWESWRTAGLTESFDVGQYTIAVVSGPGTNVTITVTGEAYGERRTIQAQMASGTPLASNYAIFANSNLAIDKNSSGSGNLFVNGNTTVAYGTEISGNIYHPSGNTVSGSGHYHDGGTPSPLPQMPVIYTATYTDQIAIAQGMVAGSVTYGGTLALSGTVYVNGNVTLSSDLVISGSGSIVATGNITTTKSITAAGNVNFICGGTFDASKDLSMSNSSIYAGTAVYIGKDYTDLNMSVKSIITPGNMTVKKNCDYNGLLYSGGSMFMDKNADVHGSVIANSLSLDKDSDYTYTATTIPANTFIGNFSQSQGSWKEL
ncbi:MAG: hypothetical protein V1843_05055 [bacterium]